ncbi:MAG: peroxidase-related enzyme [Hyphomicrobiales bacterium]
MIGKRFTLLPLEWRPWLELVDVETATKEQLAAIDAAPAGSRTSAYVLTLLHDLPSLSERSPLFNSAMYAPRGLPRAERELSTVIASMVNGCIYCASVHSRRFAELTKKPEVMQGLFEKGLEAGLEPRLRAIADFAEKLSRSPSRMTAADLEPLRQAGLDDLQLLDLIHATAMFANANRLMQTLGESVPPQPLEG